MDAAVGWVTVLVLDVSGSGGVDSGKGGGDGGGGKGGGEVIVTLLWGLGCSGNIWRGRWRRWWRR